MAVATGSRSNSPAAKKSSASAALKSGSGVGTPVRSTTPKRKPSTGSANGSSTPKLPQSGRRVSVGTPKTPKTGRAMGASTYSPMELLRLRSVLESKWRNKAIPTEQIREVVSLAFTDLGSEAPADKLDAAEVFFKEQNSATFSHEDFIKWWFESVWPLGSLENKNPATRRSSLGEQILSRTSRGMSTNKPVPKPEAPDVPTKARTDLEDGWAMRLKWRVQDGGISMHCFVANPAGNLEDEVFYGSKQASSDDSGMVSFEPIEKSLNLPLQKSLQIAA